MDSYSGSSIGSSLLTGIGGSFIYAGIAAPVERIQILLQTQGWNPKLQKEGRLTGIFNTIGRVYKTQGIFGYWKGGLASMYAIGPTILTGIIFNETHSELSVIPGFVAYTLCYPASVARAVLASDIKGDFPGTIKVLSHAYKENGFKGLYRGYTTGLISYFGSSFLMMAAVSASMGLMAYLMFSDSNLGPYTGMVGAAAFTIGAGLLSYPLDTANRKAMISIVNPDLAKEHPLGFGIYRSIIRKEGTIKGLYGGLSVYFLIMLVPMVGGLGLMGAGAMALMGGSDSDDDDEY